MGEDDDAADRRQSFRFGNEFADFGGDQIFEK
jgi:hypothetical protein